MPHLKAEGIEVDFLPFAGRELMRLLHQPGRSVAKAMSNLRHFVGRCADVIRAREYDVVVIHRAACIIGPAVWERLVAFARCPLIYDFDDAIFLLNTSEANHRFGWLKFPGKTATICRLSDHVVVGNSFLAEYASRHNSRVTVIPSSVDTDDYRPREGRDLSRRLIVGWTGSSTSQTHLEQFAPMLKRLCQQNDIEFRVHSDREPDLPGVPVVWRPWSASSEADEIAQFDIGIMPLPDDPWSRGKCAMKALLYMSAGAAAVCSAVGTNNEVIRHNENGFLAATEAEFLARVEDLINDRALRERLGRAARRTVEDSYSMRHCANKFAQVVREAAATHNAGTINQLAGTSGLSQPE
jgi:glycosyltransferase involved in cell wall biosynthesis